MYDRNISRILYTIAFSIVVIIFGWLFLRNGVVSNEPVQPEIIFEEPVIEEQEPPTDEIECMAINAYHEARDQSVAGQLAVMHVVLNRVASKKFPDTVCGVVTQGPTYVNWLGNTWPIRDRCQFSWYCDGKSDTAEDTKSYESIKKLAEHIMSNDLFDYTEGSTHYHADYVKPKWRKHFRRIVKIDNHIFYE